MSTIFRMTGSAFTDFLGPGGPHVLHLIGLCARPSARISSPPSPFPSSPPSVPSPLVTPVTPVVVVVVVSFSWGTHDFDNKSYSDGQDHGDHGGNDDNDLFTSHDQQGKKGAGGGFQHDLQI